jgi:hypothetical protein
MYYLRGNAFAEPFGPSAGKPGIDSVESSKGGSISPPLVTPGAPVIGGKKSGKKKKKKNKGPTEYAVPVRTRPSKNWIIAGAVLGVIMAGFLVYKYAGLIRK